MPDLTDYAKREAEARRLQRLAEGRVSPNVYALGYRRATLDLAEQLQRDDVIEAGVLAYTEARDDQSGRRSAFKEVLAAMLTKITEGAE